MLLPAVPAIGAVVLVVALHLTSLLVPVGVGIWIVVALAAAAIVGAFVRSRTWRMVPARSLLAWVLVLAIGAIGAVLVLLPSLIAQSPLAIQPSGSNDAFYYVSVAQWLLDNPLTSLPDIGVAPAPGADSPAYGPALESLQLGLRVGQELVNAGVSAVVGATPVATLSPMLGVYVWMIPGAAWIVGAAFRLNGIARLVLGGVLVTSFSLVNQSLNQNADSILGIALLPLVIGLCSLVLFRGRDQARATPLWLAAMSLAALVGTYTEYVPFLFATLGAITLVGPLEGLKTRLLRAVGILAVSVAVGPVIWVRAVHGLLLAASLSTRPDTAVPSASDVLWLFTGPYQAVLRGDDPVLAGLPTQITAAALLATIAIGVVVALVSPSARGVAVGALAASGGAVYIAFRGNSYITGRAIDMVTPVLIIAAILGWATVGRLTMARAARPVAIALASLMIVGGVGATAVGARTVANNSLLKAADDRVVSPEFAEAAEWIAGLDDGTGADVLVAVGTQYDQLWLSDALARYSGVGYISLRGDLGYRSNLELEDYWDGAPDRFVLVGPGAYAVNAPDAVVASNARFTLLDLDKDATVAVPVVDNGNWSWVVDGSGSISSLKSARVQLLTSRSSLSGLAIDLVGVTDGAHVQVTSGDDFREEVAAADGRSTVPLDSVPVVDGLAQVVLRTLGTPPSFSLAGVTSE